jgi:sulfate transport system permease protein
VLALLVFAPLVTVFAEALRKGWWEPPPAGNREALAAIRLTLTVAAIAVP